MLYVTGTARVSQAPVVRQTDKGTLMTTVNVAWSNNRAGDEESSFVQVLAFGQTAELLGDRVIGEKIAVQGRLQIRSNKANGTTYSNTTVLVDRVDFESTREEREALLTRRGQAAPYELTEKGVAAVAEKEAESVQPDDEQFTSAQVQAALTVLQAAGFELSK